MNEERTVGLSHAEEIVIRGATLEVVEGPDKGKTARVESPVFLIGTSDRCDLRLRDPAVSREHCSLHVSETGIALRDESSLNGTWIGGTRLHRAALSADTRLRLGSTSIVVRIDAETSTLPISSSGRFGHAIGTSPAMRVVFALLERAAPTDLTVLLEGESGVGKEVLARSVHETSKRKDGPFVPVDCGAIPAHLVESELFGHVKGAFTGATANRDGLFVEADGGTVFLDEIGELPIDLQPKLLRVLEQREVRPVGANQARRIEVRVVAATNRHLTEAVAEGRFREDLLYRLSVVRVRVPPLRDRRDDVLVLARSFLAETTGDPTATLPPDIEGMLASYAWPGNVRELRNAVLRFAALGIRDRESLLADVPAPPSPKAGVPADIGDLPYNEAKARVLDDFDRAYVEAVLAKTNGVVARAAEEAGIGRASFYRMLERLKARTGR